MVDQHYGRWGLWRVRQRSWLIEGWDSMSELDLTDIDGMAMAVLCSRMSGEVVVSRYAQTQKSDEEDLWRLDLVVCDLVSHGMNSGQRRRIGHRVYLSSHQLSLKIRRALICFVDRRFSLSAHRSDHKGAPCFLLQAVLFVEFRKRKNATLLTRNEGNANSRSSRKRYLCLSMELGSSWSVCLDFPPSFSLEGTHANSKETKTGQINSFLFSLFLYLFLLFLSFSTITRETTKAK